MAKDIKGSKQVKGSRQIKDGGKYADVRAKKRERFAKPARKNRSSTPILAAAGGGVLVVAALAFLWSGAQPPASQADATGSQQVVQIDGAVTGPTSFAIEDGAVRIPLSTFDDGMARFYAYHEGSATINFFILRSSDGVVRAAFDACDVCHPAGLGYRQEGDEMVCNNCGQRFPSVLINEVRGGCNPAPLDRAVDGGDLVITVEDILSGGGYFQ